MEIIHEKNFFLSPDIKTAHKIVDELRAEDIEDRISTYSPNAIHRLKTCPKPRNIKKPISFRQCGKELLELTKEQSFHETSRWEPSQLDDVEVLIAGGMGSGLARRLHEKNIRALVTKETDPDRAVKHFLQGTLQTEPFEPHEHDHKNQPGEN